MIKKRYFYDQLYILFTFVFFYLSNHYSLMEFRKDIQGLRAIAVLFVFIFHINSSWLPGGFIGVDIFFVISGFLISSIILHKLDNNRFSFKDFYISRIKRIVPAYYFLLLIVAFFGVFFFMTSDINVFRKSFFWSLLFNSNHYFTSLDTYFGASSSENPLLHTWTLAVEMKFYLFLPILLFLIKRKYLFKVIFVLTIILFIFGSIEIANNNKDQVYYSLLARTPEFFMGVLAALLTKKINIPKKSGLAISLSGITLLIISVFYINEHSSFPGALSFIPCFATTLLLVAPDNLIRKVLSHKFFVFIGEISYSLYLWHWPIMAYIRYYYNTNHFNLYQVLLITILSFLLSILSYYLIETPLRKKKGKSFVGVLSLLILINISAVFLIIPLNKKTSFLPIEFISPTVGMKSHSQTFEEVEVFGDTLSQNPKILFLGDSHALCMKPYLDYIGKRNSFSFKTITNDKYPTIPGLPSDIFTQHRYYKQYLNLIDHVTPLIAKCDIIILQYAGSGEKLIAPVKELIHNLTPYQDLILFSDFPTLGKNPIKINRGILKNEKRNNVYTIKQSYPNNEILELIRSNSNCHYLDLTQSNVFKTVPFYNDTIMYYDSGHLNLYGASEYAKDTERIFMKLLNSIAYN